MESPDLKMRVLVKKSMSTSDDFGTGGFSICSQMSRRLFETSPNIDFEERVNRSCTRASSMVVRNTAVVRLQPSCGQNCRDISRGYTDCDCNWVNERGDNVGASGTSNCLSKSHKTLRAV